VRRRRKELTFFVGETNTVRPALVNVLLRRGCRDPYDVDSDIRVSQSQDRKSLFIEEKTERLKRIRLRTTRIRVSFERLLDCVNVYNVMGCDNLVSDVQINCRYDIRPVDTRDERPRRLVVSSQVCVPEEVALRVDDDFTGVRYDELFYR
jgi:hypothetical protein